MVLQDTKDGGVVMGKTDDLQALVAACNAGDLESAVGMLDEQFFDYVPRPGEPSQRDVFRQILGGVWSGLEDGMVRLSNVAEEGDEVRADLVFAGHCTGELFGVQGLGQQYELRAVVRARGGDTGLRLAFEGIDLLQALRVLGVLPYPSFAHLPVDPHPSIPEAVIRLAFNGLAMQEKDCGHLDQIQVVEPAADVCASCVETGDVWPALRQCVTCGHVGCCDAAKNKHAMKHFQETGHPMIRTITPGEGWLWCYADSAFLSRWHLPA